MIHIMNTTRARSSDAPVDDDIAYIVAARSTPEHGGGAGPTGTAPPVPLPVDDEAA